jgi:hypothetical protein
MRSRGDSSVENAKRGMATRKNSVSRVDVAEPIGR